MKYKAIIFDMDGTIVESEHLWIEASKAFLEKRGISISAEIEKELHHHMSGLGTKQASTIFKQIMLLDEPVHEIMQEKMSVANALYEKKVRFVQGFTDFFTYAQQHNLNFALATNANIETLQVTNKKLNLHQFFGEHMYTVDHVQQRAKPDPALYLHAADQLNITPEYCIAIEDSAAGIAAAKQASMLCIGITTSKNPAQTQAAHIKIDHYHEIDLPTLLYCQDLDHREYEVTKDEKE